MPRLTIDNRPVEVPAGTSVLEAAKQVGIWIPHFCYHPALGQVGACRVCAVTVLEGPVKGIQMSCMLPAQEGMVVSTTDTQALAMRAQVIEWLMLNHPHDCPVCDEGGECLLQDYTLAGGHGVRRFQGKKRTHVNQYLGPYIEHEMNRCIQCYRCVRFYQEFAGGSDFGVMGSASRVYYGRFQEGQLASPFSGNLVDICPTGVFTDKTARFRARYWDYEMAPSVCPHCSLGCNTIPAARYRELLKVMARRNDQVNGWFICDRGRFNNGTVNDPTRPRTPLCDGQEISWDEALDTLCSRVAEIGEQYGPQSLAVVGSPRLALEGNILLARLTELMGAGSLCYFIEAGEATRTGAAVSALTTANAASQAQVRGADLVAVMNGDLLTEGPMLALAVRQAWRQGARVYLVEENTPPAWTLALSLTVSCVATLAQVPFSEAQRPIIICGTTQGKPAAIAGAAAVGAKVAFTLNGPNACGTALLARQHNAVSLTEAVASGQVKGIIAFEADIPAQLLARVPFVAAADWRPTETVSRAQLVLPTTAWVEMAGTFINHEGRAQRFNKVMGPGLPIKGLDPTVHPPHSHCQEAPGSDLRPAWQVIAALLERLDEAPIAEPFIGRWASLRGLDPEGEGLAVLSGEEHGP